jgi:hypothetical protein
MQKRGWSRRRESDPFAGQDLIHVGPSRMTTSLRSLPPHCPPVNAPQGRGKATTGDRRNQLGARPGILNAWVDPS